MMISTAPHTPLLNHEWNVMNCILGNAEFEVTCHTKVWPSPDLLGVKQQLKQSCYPHMEKNWICVELSHGQPKNND